MKDFQLENNDVKIKGNKIQMIAGDNLLSQKIQKVLSTNKGELFYNEDEGIDFRNILKKNTTEDEVKAEILDGLLQIDESFVLTEFNMQLDSSTRQLAVKFVAETSEGEAIEMETSW